MEPLELFAEVERQAEARNSEPVSDPGVVTLNPLEVEVATVVGTYRRRVSRERGFEDGSHTAKKKRLDQDIDAAGAELAVSKLTGCRWNMTTGDDLTEPDLWPHVEVRHTKHENGGLIVREKDKPGRLFVLVVGTCPRYRVVGWKMVDDARCDENRWQGVWKVPQSGLTPL